MKKKIIAILQDNSKSTIMHDAHIRFVREYDYSDVADEIIELMKASELSEWHSYKNELPKEDGVYLVYDSQGGGVIDIRRFEKNQWWVDVDEQITHWMPLPKKPL